VLSPEEIDEMGARITGPSDPALESARHPLRTVVWQAVGHDQKTVVEFSRLEEGAGEAEEVVAVSSHESPALGDREAKLFLVREAPAVDLVDGDDIEAKTSPDLGRRGVQVLVEEEARQCPIALVPRPIAVL
jgi:hypothetical protein